jgi:Polysaccharide deacetylase
MTRFAWGRSGVMLGGLWFLTACVAPSPRPDAATPTVPPQPAPERAAVPTPTPATPGAETAQLPPSVAVAAPLPETFESEDFVVTFAKAGDTAAGLAARFLGDTGKAWMVEDYNGAAALEPGHEVIIPKHAWNPSGVGPTGYQIVPILVYHNLGPQSKSRLTIGVAAFEEQMRYLTTQDYRVISVNEFLEFASLRRQLPRKSVVLTFDDGWKPFREFAYPILKELGFTATLFIYTDFVGSRSALSWDEIRQLEKEGFQIEAHSKTHSD